jgi:protein-disulfide isomerase
MKRISALAIFFTVLVVILSACVPSSSASTNLPSDNEFTSYPTYTFYPTYTLYPTYTPFPKDTAIPTPTPIASANGLNMGNPDAKVKVIEFADFQCPYCQRYYKEIEPTIIREFIDSNLIYYTYSPMSFLGQESIDAAEAAFCANDQGKFWEYRSFLYENLQGENVGSYSEENLVKFADDLGLDVPQFTECLTSGQYSVEVTNALDYARKSGITRTPSFRVNGKYASANELEQVIRDALNN